MSKPSPHVRPNISPDTFFWATGIEDTFITAPWPATGRILDEYELTGHYDLWRQDLDLMASLGVRTAKVERGALPGGVTATGVIDFNARDVAIVRARHAGAVTGVTTASEIATRGLTAGQSRSCWLEWDRSVVASDFASP